MRSLPATRASTARPTTTRPSSSSPTPGKTVSATARRCSQEARQGPALFRRQPDHHAVGIRVVGRTEEQLALPRPVRQNLYPFPLGGGEAVAPPHPRQLGLFDLDHRKSPPPAF